MPERSPPSGLGTALAGLPRPWSVFRHRQASALDADRGESGGGLYIVLHPGKGIALIDSELATPLGAMLRLRHLLQATRFEPFLRGQPPVIALALDRGEPAAIEQSLAKAFAAAGPCRIADAGWTALAVSAIAAVNSPLTEINGGDATDLARKPRPAANPMQAAARLWKPALARVAGYGAERIARAAGAPRRLGSAASAVLGQASAVLRSRAKHAADGCGHGALGMLTATRDGLDRIWQGLRSTASVMASGFRARFAAACRAIGTAMGKVRQSAGPHLARLWSQGRQAIRSASLDLLHRARRAGAYARDGALSHVGAARAAIAACRQGLRPAVIGASRQLGERFAAAFGRRSVALGVAGASLCALAALLLIHTHDAGKPVAPVPADPVPAARQPRLSPLPLKLQPAAMPEIEIQPVSSEASVVSSGESEKAKAKEPRERPAKKMRVAPPPQAAIAPAPPRREKETPRPTHRQEQTTGPYDGPAYDYANRQAN